MANKDGDALQDLIDSPKETLAVEYKGWLDLAENREARADLARHIGALANHGGGYIVFGISNDTMGFAGPNPFPKVVFNHDLIAGIVKKYLEPPFQCDVHVVKSAAGNDHPVIIVPPHGAAPVCAKATGPVIDGKPKGITQGVYYARKPGPESAPISTAAEWAPIIRRCAMHERASILGAIDAALRGANMLAQVASTNPLKTWHDAARSALLMDIAAQKAPQEWEKWYCQFSYMIERSDSERLNANELREMLRQVNAEVRDLVHTGWSMFYIFSRRDIEPFFNTDPASGQGDDDFLECTLVHDTQFLSTGPRLDMWRVSPDGKATLIREYWEDSPDWNRKLAVERGTWFSPLILVRSLAELVRHARGVSERFDSPTTASFRCEWHGLAGRFFGDPEAPSVVDRRIARNNHTVAAGTWPVATLTNSWPEIVASLAAPVARLFGAGDLVTAQWILEQATRWTR